ncbi:MAG: tRNA pseudouridine(38-40) synthase TruA [Planctomycetaceae bacterium]
MASDEAENQAAACGFTRNIMLTIAYDGTNYSGWQIQPRVTTVQECVERAVEKLTGVRSAVLCAGRTDAGVHAVGQVASFRTSSQIPANQIRRGLQSFLPIDIVIVKAEDVSMKFHATFSAVRKIYRYMLFDGTVCPPFVRRYVNCIRNELDVPAMQQSLIHLLGTHDFRCFETRYPNKATSIRTIERAEIRRLSAWTPWQSGHEWHSDDSHISQMRSGDSKCCPFVMFEVQADGFLYNMVRAIVGTLIRIGVGQRPPDDMQRVIESMDRKQAGMTSLAQGLCLTEVFYPPELLRPDDAD